MNSGTTLRSTVWRCDEPSGKQHHDRKQPLPHHGAEQTSIAKLLNVRTVCKSRKSDHINEVRQNDAQDDLKEIVSTRWCLIAA
jgi:hypothetical protein